MRKKNLHMAQETTTSLGPCFFFGFPCRSPLSPPSHRRRSSFVVVAASPRRPLLVVVSPPPSSSPPPLAAPCPLSSPLPPPRRHLPSVVPSSSPILPLCLFCFLFCSLSSYPWFVVVVFPVVCRPVVVNSLNWYLKNFVSKKKRSRKIKIHTCGPRDVDDVSWAVFPFGLPRCRRLPVVLPLAPSTRPTSSGS